MRARAMSEVQVVHEPLLLEHLQVVVDRGEIGRRKPMQAAAMSSALIGQSAATNAISTSRRAAETR